MAYLIRRRKLGRTSAREIANYSKTGIRAYRNDMRLPVDQMVFRWGCVSELPGEPTVINTARAIGVVDDKVGFRRVMDAEDLCPTTYYTEEDVVFPCIIRPKRHHQGRHLYVCNNRVELYTAMNRCVKKSGGWYGSEIIKKVSEYRVFVVQGRCVCVAQKFPGNPNQVAWNVFQGGRFENVAWDNWPLKAVKVSIEAFNLSGLDFGGVDVMVDREGECYVLEINAAPSLTSPYRQQCFAKAFDYIVQHGKKMIPLPEEKGGYRKFIHPAITQNARV